MKTILVIIKLSLKIRMDAYWVDEAEIFLYGSVCLFDCAAILYMILEYAFGREG